MFFLSTIPPYFDQIFSLRDVIIPATALKFVTVFADPCVVFIIYNFIFQVGPSIHSCSDVPVFMEVISLVVSGCEHAFKIRQVLCTRETVIIMGRTTSVSGVYFGTMDLKIQINQNQIIQRKIPIKWDSFLILFLKSSGLFSEFM